MPRLTFRGRTWTRDRAMVMAIVNRTPDSFYDHGATFAEQAARAAVTAAVREGADVLDIGGVPASPGSEVTETEEIDRVVPTVEWARSHFPDVVISVDTFRAGPADAVCKAGADLVNDNWAAADPSIRPLIRHDIFRPGLFPDGSFSLVTCFQTIEHLADPLSFCRDAWRALKPGGALFLIGHDRLTRPKERGADEKRQRTRRGGSAFIFGAGLALAELPTAFPYFAALAAIEAADVSVPAEAALVVVFNLLFLLPVFLIAGLIAVFPSIGESLVEPIRRWMSRHWPQVLATVLGTGGAILVIVGARGL